MKPEQSNPFGEPPPDLYFAPLYLPATRTTSRPLPLASRLLASCVAPSTRWLPASFRVRPSATRTARPIAPRRRTARSSGEPEISLVFRSCSMAPLSERPERGGPDAPRDRNARRG